MIDMIDLVILFAIVIFSAFIAFMIILVTKWTLASEKADLKKVKVLEIPSELRSVDIRPVTIAPLPEKSFATRQTDIGMSTTATREGRPSIIKLSPRQRPDRDRITNSEIAKKQLNLGNTITETREGRPTIIKFSPRQQILTTKLTKSEVADRHVTLTDSEKKAAIEGRPPIIKLAPRARTQAASGFRRMIIEKQVETKTPVKPTVGGGSAMIAMPMRSTKFHEIPIIKLAPQRNLKVISPFKSITAKTCADCGKTFPVVASFCPFCGRKTVSKCPHCNAVLVPRSIRCHKCGAMMQDRTG